MAQAVIKMHISIKFFTILGIFLISIAFIRFGISIDRAIQIGQGYESIQGELLANFPMYFILENYNMELYNSVKSSGGTWFEGGWFYGPMHHMAHIPLLIVANSIQGFFNILLFLYVISSISFIYIFSKYFFKDYDKLFFVYIIALTMGNFSFLENIQQRNSELLEFLLLFIALFAAKHNRSMVLGVSLSSAFLVKLLPIIFFPYLILKKHYKAALYYTIFVTIISVLTSSILGWDNWKLLSSMSEHGMPTIGKILDNQLFADISQQRGSFYTFILSFISDVEVTNQATIVKYSFAYIGVINWLFIIICLMLSTLTARIVYLNKKDVFFDFALIATLMLIVYPRVNPHYYIFALFGIYYVTYIFFQYKEINKINIINILLYLVILLLLGEFIPFSIINHIFDLNYPFFHFIASYGLQGFGVFLLWCLLILVAPVKLLKYKRENKPL